MMLAHKEEKLIASLKRLLTGQEPSFVFDYVKEKHYQVWFYSPFEFNYTVIGQENFRITITDETDDSLIAELQNKFEQESQRFKDQEFNDYLRTLEFEFFATCWDKLQKELNQNLRCFLIEYGIIRGLDVNNRTSINGDNIGEILAEEGN